ncbi:MAG: ABC-type uncharacterized transport system, periplasmic component [Solidesulfovibrio magneticus str. Maddingley MBC34]|uniref:ABC-type uncharacterized transport system, periplasmic component n=1 Tax=Solidesulfovibrio magneticus str. Maddingley MBC34 TaxID=1206767 RepID=K6GF87_9BACT|nr:MAG: ABC-type uncharacterized transport system, periplasmic component [Solidesulfovibrio magneticus str. Maddingley MBC34]
MRTKLLAICGILIFVLAVCLAKATFMRKDEKTLIIAVVQFTCNNLDTLEGFKTGMAKAGYEEGRQVKYLIPEPAQSREELDRHLAQVLAQKPDLLFVSPTLAAVAAKAATAANRVPVIFAPVNDPVSSGVVANIQTPEANLTGVRLAPSEGRRLQALLSLVPNATKVFVPYNPKESSAMESLHQIRDAAMALGVEIEATPIGAPHEFPITTELIPAGAGAIFMLREGLVMSRFKEFLTVADALGIPLSTPRLDQVEHGVTTGFGFIGTEVGMQAARMAALLLGGVPPSRIPVETAQDYLFVNLEAAAQIGLEVKESSLRQASRVIVVRRTEQRP